MLFTSPFFLFVYLPLFLLAYYLAPKSTQAKNHVALVGSILFFAWGEPIFVLALIAGTYVDYKISQLIAPDSSSSDSNKKLILTFAIILNVAILIVSKYLNFVVAQIAPALDVFTHIKLHPTNIPLLLGISFITFHKISYLVDSYKGRAIPPRNFFDCALYIFLFPQLIAGPIIRYHDIGSQIHARKHTAEGALTGFFRFSVGLAKKIIIADPLGLIADKIFGMPAEGTSFVFAWGGIIAYTLQIYFDFSGYSDMAIGLGRMMGFRFPENFNRPYISRSVTEFWRRWHISLSTWMRLYLYIPLGGNRVSLARTYINLWVVFLISGIWHGASWNFVVWGAYYGFFLCFERALSSGSNRRSYTPAILRQTLTMGIVIVGWVFFRSPSLDYAISYIAAMLGLNTSSTGDLQPWGLVFGNRGIATMVLAAILAMVTVPKTWIDATSSLRAAWTDSMTIGSSRAINLHFIACLFFILLSASAVVSSDYVAFLYFRF